jgi:hypothetical protein
MSAQGMVDRMREYGTTTTRSTLSNFENGLRDDVSLREAIAMALVLEVDLVDLVVGLPGFGSVRLGERNISFHELRSALAGERGLSRAQERKVRQARRLLDQLLNEGEE